MNDKHTSSYTIVGFLSNNALPRSFSESNWPLHVTLLDPFKTEWSQKELSAQMQEFALKTHPFLLKLSKRSFLGPNKDVPVTLLEVDENMSRLHNELLELGKHGSFVYNTPGFVGEGFVPHITDAADERAEFNKYYDVLSISIVDTIPDGDPSRRSIVATFDLAR